MNRCWVANVNSDPDYCKEVDWNNLDEANRSEALSRWAMEILFVNVTDDGTLPYSVVMGQAHGGKRAQAFTFHLFSSVYTSSTAATRDGMILYDCDDRLLTPSEAGEVKLGIAMRLWPVTGKVSVVGWVRPDDGRNIGSTRVFPSSCLRNLDPLLTTLDRQWPRIGEPVSNIALGTKNWIVDNHQLFESLLVWARNLPQGQRIQPNALIDTFRNSSADVLKRLGIKRLSVTNSISPYLVREMCLRDPGLLCENEASKKGHFVLNPTKGDPEGFYEKIVREAAPTSTPGERRLRVVDFLSPQEIEARAKVHA